MKMVIAQAFKEYLKQASPADLEKLVRDGNALAAALQQASKSRKGIKK